ncbi:MAG: tetratricopeptide repeat protein [Pirellulales bacterium]
MPQRHQELSNQFSDLKGNWSDGDWHSWTGPNGGQINHIGFWGPNGYWGHTGAWGPNGGHIGHSTGIGPNGAYGRTSGWGPNGNYFGRGAAVGPGGGVAWAHGGGPAGYWSRSWGWYNGYGPAWGYGRWDYLWNQYPVAMAFGATMWGLNAVAYTMGVGDYYNPYYDTSGSYPTSYAAPLTGDPSYETPQAEDADAENDPLTRAFNEARAAFQQDQYDQALQLTDDALKQAPRDAALNEFRSLCLFALGRYRESAATIHAVLAAGPGWDWTTMISLYSSEDVYTAQLRKLEAAAGADATSADMRFLLAYHYLTADHPDAAVEMWKQVVQINPQDKLSSELLAMYGPSSYTSPTSPAPSTPAALPPDIDKPAYTAEQLAGDWKAKTDGGEFALKLGADNAFTWSFTRDGKPQTVTGAYALGGNNLVMQPDTGGTMLSTITLEGANTLQFAPIGDAEKLTFTK